MIIVLRSRLPAFDDSIYLHREFTVLTSCWIPAILGNAPSVIVEMVWGKNVISSFLEHFAAIFAASVTPFISTVWVLRQIRNSDEMHLVRQLTQNGVHLSVREILADNHLIQSFMDHLIHEFSAENLLALIEFQQFRIHLMDKYGSKVFVPDTTDGDDVVLELAE